MKNNAGMTLVEVIIALAIVFVVFMGLSNSGLVVLDQNIKNSQRDEAVSVADYAMQQARNTPFDNLVAGTTSDNVFRQIRGLNMRYDVTRTVASLDPMNRQLTITVAWSRYERGRIVTYNHQAMSIVRKR